MATAKTTSKTPAKKPAARTAAPAAASAVPKTPAAVHFKTPSGFECDISPVVWDDIEMLDLLVDVSSGDAAAAAPAVPRLLSKVFTTEQKKAFYDHIRTPDGRVPLQPVIEDLIALITDQGDDAKK